MVSGRIGRQNLGISILAGSASLEFAFGALIDPPMWTRMANHAIPEDESRVKPDYLEAVRASARFAFAGHGAVIEILASARCADIATRGDEARSFRG